MTISLVAVFIPVLFMGGILGRLLHEFAVTIMAAMLISGFVSLTLTPMLCSRFLRPHHGDARHGRLYMAFERGFDAWTQRLRRARCDWTLRHQRVMLALFVAVCAGHRRTVRDGAQGLPAERGLGQLFCFTEGPQDVSFEAMVELQAKVAEIIRQDPNVEAAMSFVGASGFSPSLNVGRITITLKPFEQRKPADQVMRELRPKISNVLGVKAFIQNVPPIRIGGGLTKSPYQYVMQQHRAPRSSTQWAPRDRAEAAHLPG